MLPETRMAEPSGARQVSLEEAPAERAPAGARPRAERAPAPQLSAARAESFEDSDRAPGLQTLEIVREEGGLVLQAELEPRFRLEIELDDREWLELSPGEDGLVRYALDESALGELRPGRVLRLRTVASETGVAAPFGASIPD